jgi:hypothetical protein
MDLRGGVSYLEPYPTKEMQAALRVGIGCDSLRNLCKLKEIFAERAALGVVPEAEPACSSIAGNEHAPHWWFAYSTPAGCMGLVHITDDLLQLLEDRGEQILDQLIFLQGGGFTATAAIQVVSEGLNIPIPVCHQSMKLKHRI